ncbi:MAG TPA: hypothetical protein VFS44_07955, partial [Gemmatimonadaceae bacterium]|nr:hypothetical protein [Gemmatimonadaceae bacterium]
GRYWVVLTPLPSDARVLLRVDSIAVDVRAYHHIEVALLDAPRRIAAGSSYAATFAVRNAGNVEGTVTLRVASGNDLPTSLDSGMVHLRPGASAQVRVVVRTDGLRSRHLLHRLELRASLAARDSVPPASAASVVELIPQVTEPAHRFHTLPAEVAVRGISVKGAPGTPEAMYYTGELRARGTLTDGGDTQLDVLLRGPQPAPLVAFGERDEYRIGLGSSRADLRLGDQSVALSPLTESGRSGFGASGRVTTGPLTVGGFALRSRWGSTFYDDRHEGGFATARLGTSSTLGVTYLSRGGSRPGSLWAVRGSVAPIPGTRVDAEYGFGASATRRSTANTVSLTGSWARLGISAQHLAAGRDYPGSASGTAYDGGSAWVRVWRQLAVHGQIAEQSHSIPFLATTIDDRQRRMEGGIAYGSAIGADYVRTERAGSLLLGRGGVQESVRLRARARLGPLTIAGLAERGRSRERAAVAEWRPFEHEAVQALLAPGTRMSYGVSVDRWAGSSLYTSWSREQMSATANATMRLGHDATRIRLLARGVRDGTNSSFRSGSVDAAVEQRLPFGHELSARVRLRTFAGVAALGESVAELEYRVPLGIPVSHSRTSARISGRVYDVESGRGVANALVRVGGRAVLTDGAGRLMLTGIRPGVQYLELDRGSIGLDRVPTQENPLPVKVTVGGTTRVELGVVRAARVSGQVDVFNATAAGAADSGSSITRVGGLQGAIVALTSGSEIVRRVTDGDGRFRFEDLRPGRWTLRVERAMLPPEHYLEQEAFELDVAPGSDTAIAARVLPRKRAIRIIIKGELDARSRDSTAVAHLRPAGDTVARVAAADSSVRRTDVAAGREARAQGAIHHRYTVTRWDTDLPSIAGFVYGDSALWPKLWLANRRMLRSAERLPAGVRLFVPDSAPLTSEEIAARDSYTAGRHGVRSGAPGSTAVRHWYTVTRWDTNLMAIASFMYGDAALWPKIWVANRCRLVSPTVLPDGLRLRVPDPGPLTDEEMRARDALARDGTDPAREGCARAGRRP